MANEFSLIRTFHNLNKTETARRVGLSLSYVSELERGVKKPTLEVYQKYAEGFGMPLSSLMLFAESTNDRGVEIRAKAMIQGKVIQMLEWLAWLGEEAEDGRISEAVSAKK